MGGNQQLNIKNNKVMLFISGNQTYPQVSFFAKRRPKKGTQT